MSTPDATGPTVPSEMLQPASGPPDWNVKKDYATATVVPDAVPDNCKIKVFPAVPKALAAFSGVLRPTENKVEPGHILIQRFNFQSGYEANQSFSLIENEVKAIHAAKFLLSGSEQLEIKEESATVKMLAHVASNGTAYAIYIEQRGPTIQVLRADQPDIPPMDSLREQAEILFGSDWIAEPANLNDENLPGWRWSYGPIDIHPDNYAAPACS